jgi:hypothetical protein
VTALELLAGFHAARPEDFLDVKQRIATAYYVSNGRILEDPRVLICREVLKIPFPEDRLAPDSSTLSRHMDLIRRAVSLSQLLNGIPYKGRKAVLNTTSVLSDVMVGPKKSWVAAVELMADEKYPAWRELFLQTSRRLPPEMRKELEPRSVWQSQRPAFIKGLLDWLGSSTGPEVVAEMSTRLDAVLEFAIFVSREFLLRNYSVEKHHSDIFDQFQLQYLAMDRFVIVSGDPDLSTRTKQSVHAARIMSFHEFLETL